MGKDAACGHQFLCINSDAVLTPLQSSPPLLSSLLARFRASYPTGSLISEFLTVHDGNYAIRALAQVGGITLASGMAAHPNLETAEDQAKVRALEALGLTLMPVEPTSYPLPSWDYSVPVEPASIAPPKQPSLGRPTPPGLDLLQSLPEPSAPEALPAKILELVPPRVESSETDKAIKPKQDKPEEPLLVEETQDRSDEIARIGVEMKRLGWTTIQGREYLKQRYGKRSRQELNDSELLDFLDYLESQPAPSSR